MTNEAIMSFGLLKIKEFALAMGVPVSTVRTWRRRGNLPASCFRKIAGTVFVVTDEVKGCLK